jgi:hypothetical protein
MTGRRENAEDIKPKLRQVEVLQGTTPVCLGSCAADWRDRSDVLSMAQRLRWLELRSAQTVEGT